MSIILADKISIVCSTFLRGTNKYGGINISLPIIKLFRRFSIKILEQSQSLRQTNLNP